MASTSGTVALFNYTNRKILDRAFGRAGYATQKISGEAISIALDLLFTLLTSDYANAGSPLWTKQFTLAGVQVGSPDVATPVGTIDVFHAFWRILQPYRGPATLSTGAGDNLLFGGQPNADVVIAGPNPSVTVNFTSPTELDTVGVLLGNVAAVTTALNVQVSNDNGLTFSTVQTLPLATYPPLSWVYFDLDPTITAQYVRLQYVTGGSWTLNQLMFGLANGVDIELGQLSMDNYYNLPNKQFQSERPNSVFIDRTNTTPTLRIWPTPDLGAYYSGTVSMVSRRQIMDPGSLTNIVEAPPRWYEAIQWRLAHRIITGIPEDTITGQPADMSSIYKIQEKQARIALCDKEATKAEYMAWSEERTRGPIQLYPAMRAYTS